MFFFLGGDALPKKLKKDPSYYYETIEIYTDC